MSLINLKNKRFPWINDSVSNWLDTNAFFSDDFFVKNSNVPAMNVKEGKKDFEIELAVPGYSKEDIKVTMEDDVLHISAKSNKEEIKEDANYTRQEFTYQEFDRKLQLPTTIDQQKEVKASYKNGILKFKLLKKENALEFPKKIFR
ncbi:Hsp20/alpha crystallin family protein [Aquimarina sp. W85]|uniref:Hsp20/alpha crystallin family protein n=1 Tax=Aquimarina rhodophyticola TaxID=3342246 RepID=UPI00366ADC9F